MKSAARNLVGKQPLVDRTLATEAATVFAGKGKGFLGIVSQTPRTARPM